MTSIPPMDTKNTYFDSFNKCTKILVQVKYQMFYDNDLHYWPPSQNVTFYYSPNLVRK